MKMNIKNIAGCVLLSLLASCSFDNYEAPEATFEGRIVYNGEPINVSYNDVYFELWEPGWQTSIPINVSVDQDGSFSSLLFNANYKLVFPPNQGPFQTLTNETTDSDTIPVNIKGSKSMDIEVLPYYMVRNSAFSVNGGNVAASCQLEQIIKDDGAREVENIALYVGKTYFVDARNTLSTTEIAGGDIADMNNISLSTGVPEIIPAQDHVFARIGVKIAGVEDMIFSPVQQLDIN